MLPDDPEMNWVRMLIYVGFAAVAGALGHVMRTIDKNDRVSILLTMVQGAAAGFVGSLVYLLCLAFKLDLAWTGVVVGVFGWMGANATIKVLERVVFKKLGIDSPVQDIQRERQDDPS